MVIRSGTTQPLKCSMIDCGMQIGQRDNGLSVVRTQLADFRLIQYCRPPVLRTGDVHQEERETGRLWRLEERADRTVRFIAGTPDH